MTSSTADSPRAARLRQRLDDARLYLCIDTRRHFDNSARSDGVPGAFPALRRDLSVALEGGVDIVQLRDKNSNGERRHGKLEAGAELEALQVVRDVCDEYGALMAVNDRADIARAAGADLLHVGQKDLPVDWAREIVGPDTVIGQSCHTAEQVDAAVSNANVDYYCTGPVWPTPTKPGRPAAGLDLVRYAAGLSGTGDSDAKPWFAIGGISPNNVADVVDAGARRVVVVRAITGSADPTSAARSLRDAVTTGAEPGGLSPAG